MFDLTNEESFANLEGWLKEIEKRSSRKMCKIIVGNKLDLVESGEKERKVAEKDILDFCLRHSLTFKYSSALTGINVEESFHDLVDSNRFSIQKSLMSISTPFPSYINVCDLCFYTWVLLTVDQYEGPLSLAGMGPM